MRLRNPWPAQPRNRALAAVVALTLFTQTSAVSFSSVASPNLDLSQLGRVTLAGNFDSASLYSYLGQTENTESSNGSQSILARYPTGAFADLQSADAAILTMCPYIRSDGSLGGVVVGGNFTSLGGGSAQGMAMYMPNNDTVVPLAGLTGQVTSVFCDTARQTAYVGGSFTGGNSTNAISWTGAWQPLPFAGFNGPVSAVAQLPNGNIIFGGTFTGTGNLSSPTTQSAQAINVGSANVTADGSAARPGFSNPRNIVCKTSNQTGVGNEWLLADDTPGSWSASFRFGFVPTRLRLYNSQASGYATRTWRFVDGNTGGIMNFTYGGANGLESCTAQCPLTRSAAYQDFNFVNFVGMDNFTIYISDWYGRGGGLGGIELFENDIYASAIEAFNEPRCDANTTLPASVITTGSWSITPSGDSISDYLTATLPDGTLSGTDISVIFYPDIKQSGNYSVTLYTPGCIGDNTCPSRGIVNITSNLGASAGTPIRPTSTQLYQTNNNQKYDQVYFGYIDATNSQFRPSVTLTPAAGQDGPLTVVAQRVRFDLIASTGGLNGLYEFNPNGSTLNTDFSASTIDNIGTQLNDGAQVYALCVANSATYVGGAFSSNSATNIMAIEGGNITSLPGGGLNQPVQSLYATSSHLYASGNFTSTAQNTSTGLNNIAAYSFSSQSWEALGAGVDGVVYNIVPIQVNISSDDSVVGIAFSGFFDQVNAFDNYTAYSVDNIAIWVPSSNNWLQNLNTESIALSGRLTAEVNVPGNGQLFAGAVRSQALRANGAVSLSTSGTLALEQLPINIQVPEQSATSLTSKRAMLRESVQGVMTGAYYNDNGLNLTILGGSFTAEATNGSTVHNLAFINGTDNNSVTGLTTNFSSSDAILAVAVHGNLLFAGGTIPSGILLYDLATASISSAQPPAVNGEAATVNTIASQPSASSVYVGGSFTSAGLLPCAALCVYDTSLLQWLSPGPGLSASSVITNMQWASDTRLILAGNMSIGGNYTTFASYDSTSRTFTGFPGAGNSAYVPGQISTFTPTDNTYSSFFVAGTSAASSSSFLSYYDSTDSSWTSLSGLDPASVVESLQLLGLTSDHATTATVPAGQTLLVGGQLQLLDYGNVSAALYNGTSFTPFLLTSMRDGSPGTVRAAFVQNTGNLISNSGGPSHLAIGYVVLIALAIALALIFLLVITGILVEQVRRRREGYVPAPTNYTAYNTATPPTPTTPIPASGAGAFGTAAAAGYKRRDEEEKIEGGALPPIAKHPPLSTSMQGMLQRMPPEELFGSVTSRDGMSSRGKEK